MVAMIKGREKILFVLKIPEQATKSHINNARPKTTDLTPHNE